MPVLICTVFSFAAFFYPIEAEEASGVFSDSIAVEPLDMRNNVAAMHEAVNSPSTGR